MVEQILSMAAIEALPSREDELLATLRELYNLMDAKGYSRDALYRDTTRPDRFLHLRYWNSAQMRSEAQADPDVHRYWLKLPELCIVTVLYESLEKLFET
jgi:antibiotic biosynthesis monooxygenase